MANITEVKRKNGDTAYVLRFTRQGKIRRISFDASYTRQEVEETAGIVDTIVQNEKKGEYLDRRTRVYLDNLPWAMQKKFAAVGLVCATNQITLERAWRLFLEYKNQEVAPSTQKIWKLIGDRLLQLFDGQRQLCSITEQDAHGARNQLAKVYQEATVATTIGRFRTFWSWAVKSGYAETNVFLAVRKGSDVNHSKDFQIPRDWTERILDACPTQNWRTLFALWRVGGLRQQEPLGLTWNCVLWDKRRLIVPSPKTSRYEGRENREIPLFPILARELQASRQIAPDGEAYIVFENRRQNFDSGFKRILFWAGLEPWQKLFQNMRCSCENDLIEDGYPAHVVGAWLGHTSKVQQRHYLRVLDSFYENAVK